MAHELDHVVAELRQAINALDANHRAERRRIEDRLREGEQRLTKVETLVEVESDRYTPADLVGADQLRAERQERIDADQALSARLDVEHDRTTRWSGGMAAVVGAVGLLAGVAKVLSWLSQSS